MLSKAGKEILIKEVAQAIPLYTRACFDITKSLCDDLSSMIRHYRWSQMDKMHCVPGISCRSRRRMEDWDSEISTRLS
jgi:hypothetical protein